MIKIINICLLFASCSSVCFATQTPVSLQKFVPKNWEIISQADGDLNQDGTKDIALIIQPKNTQILDRKLLILFNKRQQFKLITTQKIPSWTYRADESCVDDALSGAGVNIENGTLDIGFHNMSSCSNWYGEAWTYRFKWNNSEFKLIGTEYWFLNKNNGTFTSYSGNYLTHKQKKTEGNEFDQNIKSTITWKVIPSKPSDSFNKIQLEDSQNFLKHRIIK